MSSHDSNPQQPYGQQPYGQQPYGQQPYGQPPPPGWGAPGGSPPRPNNPLPWVVALLGVAAAVVFAVLWATKDGNDKKDALDGPGPGGRSDSVMVPPPNVSAPNGTQPGGTAEDSPTSSGDEPDCDTLAETIASATGSSVDSEGEAELPSGFPEPQDALVLCAMHAGGGSLPTSSVAGAYESGAYDSYEGLLIGSGWKRQSGTQAGGAILYVAPDGQRAVAMAQKDGTNVILFLD